LAALSRSPLCDDCLSKACAIFPRQQVNQRCAYLLEVGHASRRKEPCPKCGKYKFVNRVRSEAVETIRRRSITIQVEPDKVKPLTEDDIREGGVICILPETRGTPWFWEGNVQRCIVEHLVGKGYQITRVAETKKRESGKDIEARLEDGRKLWLTVKGYPEKSAHTQARHWFAEALFDLILYREEDATAELGIGLPHGFSTYRHLARRIDWFKDCVPFRFWWVQRDGTVRVE